MSQQKTSEIIVMLFGAGRMNIITLVMKKKKTKKKLSKWLSSTYWPKTGGT